MGVFGVGMILVDATWLRHSVFTRTDDGPECSFAPVAITRFQPEARSY